MDLTELTATAETSSRIIGLHLVRCLLRCLFVCGLSEGRITTECVQQPFVYCLARSVVSATCFTQHYDHLQDGLYCNTRTKTLPPGLSLRGLGFYARPVQLRFVVDKVSLVQAFIRALLLPPVLHTYSVTF